MGPPEAPWWRGRAALAGAIVAVVTSAGMFYFFLVGVEYAMLPTAARRATGSPAALTDALLWLAPVPVLAGPMLAWKRRVEGATVREAWRYAGLSWLAGAGLYAAAVALRSYWS